MFGQLLLQAGADGGVPSVIPTSEDADRRTSISFVNNAGQVPGFSPGIACRGKGLDY